jgi:hypothetical protein
VLRPIVSLGEDQQLPAEAGLEGGGSVRGGGRVAGRTCGRGRRGRRRAGSAPLEAPDLKGFRNQPPLALQEVVQLPLRSAPCGVSAVGLAGCPGRHVCTELLAVPGRRRRRSSLCGCRRPCAGQRPMTTSAPGPPSRLRCLRPVIHPTHRLLLGAIGRNPRLGDPRRMRQSSPSASVSMSVSSESIAREVGPRPVAYRLPDAMWSSRGARAKLDFCSFRFCSLERGLDRRPRGVAGTRSCACLDCSRLHRGVRVVEQTWCLCTIPASEVHAGVSSFSITLPAVLRAFALVTARTAL